VRGLFQGNLTEFFLWRTPDRQTDGQTDVSVEIVM